MRLKWAIAVVAVCVIVTVAAVAYAAGKAAGGPELPTANGATVVLLGLFSSIVGGVVVAGAAYYLAPMLLQKANAWVNARAGLEVLKVYVEGAQLAPGHQDMQKKWSQLCVERFAELVTHTTTIGRAEKLTDVSRLLARWAGVSLSIGGNSGNVGRLEKCLSDLQLSLDDAIRSLDG